MDQAKTVIIETLNTNNFVLAKALENISDEHFFERPSDSSNPIHFVLGHITLYRYAACKLLGDETTYKFADLYAMGKQVQDRSVYPSADEIKLEWEVASKKLEALLAKVEIEAFAKETPKKHPIGAQNVMGAYQFIMFHETYHVGQIAILARLFGYDAVIG